MQLSTWMHDCGVEVLPKSPLGSLVALLEVERENVVASTSSETVAELPGSAVAERSGAGGGSGDGVAAMVGGEAASGDAVSGGGLTSRW
jgi:hypothetical protein